MAVHAENFEKKTFSEKTLIEDYTDFQNDEQSEHCEEELKALAKLQAAQQEYADFLARKSRKNSDLKSSDSQKRLIFSKDKTIYFAEKNDAETNMKTKVKDEPQEYQLSRDLIEKVVNNKCPSDIKILVRDRENGEAEDFSKALATNVNLKKLTANVSDTALNGGFVSFIADALKINKKLKHLVIAGYNIGSVNDHGIKDLADAIKINTTLEQLDIIGEITCRASFGVLGMTAIASALKENTALQSVSLSYIAGIDESSLNTCLDAIASALKNNHHLRKLKLHLMKINYIGSLCEALKVNYGLEELDLSQNSIHCSDTSLITKVLEKNRILRKLNLRFNPISSYGAKDLAASLNSNCYLQELNLSYCSINSMIAYHMGEMMVINDGENGTVVIADSLTKNSILQSLNLDCNGIGDEGAIAIAKALTSNKTLRSLSLAGNQKDKQIGDMGAIAIGKTFSSNKVLKYLNLENNHISAAGAKVIAMELISNPALEYLNFNLNQIGDMGAIAIGKMLVSNKTLQRLDLRSNQIGDEGAIAIAKALSSNQTLQHLELGYNKISDTAAKVIAEALTVNQTLRHLEFNGNQIGETIQRHINQAIRRNQKLFDVIVEIQANILQHVDLSNLSMNDNCLTNFFEALKNNVSVTSINLEHNLISDLGLRELTVALKSNPANKISRLNLKNNLLSQRDALEDLAKIWPGADAERKKYSENREIEISSNYFDENRDKDFHKLLTQYTFIRTACPQGIVYPSKIKADLKVSAETWLIFLMSNPRTNHAMLFFEGLDERGQLFLEMAHLTAPSLASPRGGVKTERWPSGNARKSFEKLQEYSHLFWERRFTAVQTVRAAIKKEENEPISFSSLGYGADNCLKWALNKLSIIEIVVQMSALTPYYPNLVITGRKKGDVQEPERRKTCVIS